MCYIYKSVERKFTVNSLKSQKHAAVTVPSQSALQDDLW